MTHYRIRQTAGLLVCDVTHTHDVFDVLHLRAIFRDISVNAFFKQINKMHSFFVTVL